MTTNQFENQPHPTGHSPAKPTAEQWAETFQRTEQREPTMAEYQAAVAAGEIARERRIQDPSLQQMGAGIKQVAAGARGLYETKMAPAVERSGAKDFYADKVAPAARAAASSAQQAVHQHDQKTLTGQAGSKSWVAWAPYTLPAAAFLAIFALFLPIVSGMGQSYNYFSEQVRGEGMLLLLAMLGTVTVSVLAVLRPTRGLRMTSGIVGVLEGIVGMIEGFGTMFSVSDQPGAAVGIGLVLLVLLSVIMTASGGLILAALRRSPTSSAPNQN